MILLKFQKSWYFRCQLLMVAVAASNCSEANFKGNSDKALKEKPQTHEALPQVDGVIDQVKTSATTEEECRPVVGSVEPKENLSLRWKWKEGSYPEYNQNMSAPMVADINGDKVSDFIFGSYTSSSYGTTGVLRVVSGVDGSEIFSTKISTTSNPIPGIDDIRPYATAVPAIVDINKDGKPEIIISAMRMSDSQKGLAIYGSQGELVKFLPAAIATSFSSVISVSDVNFDGKLELFTALVSSQLLTLNIIDYGARNIEIGVYKKPDGSEFTTSVSRAAELDPSKPGLELIGTTGVYGADGALLYAHPPGVSGAKVALGKFSDGEGVDYILTDQIDAHIVDGRTGKLIASWQRSPAEAAACRNSAGHLSIGDHDGDGHDDIAMAGACQYFSVRQEIDPTTRVRHLKTQWVNTTRDVSSSITGSTSYDLNGDGKVEMIYNDEFYLRIYDGKTGRELFKIANDNGTLIEYPVIASLRQGEPASIIFSANSYTSYNGTANAGVVEDPALVGAPIAGNNSTLDKNTYGNVTGIRVVQGGDNNWMPTRQLWNQYHYHISNILDDLKIPTSSSAMTANNTKTRINIPLSSATQCKK